MEIGLGALRLSPKDFWAMTPREFAAAAGLRRRADVPSRNALDELARRFPD